MALSKFIVTVLSKTDAPDNVLPNSPIEIRDRLTNGSSGLLSLIFSDSAGTIPITQTGATTDSLGQFKFFGGNANYNAEFDNDGSPVVQAIGPVVDEIANQTIEKVNEIQLDLGDVAIAASDDAVSLTNPAAIVVVPSTDNKADPAVVDQPEAADNAPTPIAATADQLHRLRNSALGETSAQSSSSLGTFAVSRKYDVTASTQFTVSIHGAPLGFIIYDVSFDVQEFDAAGEFIANIVATVDTNKRQMTFTTTTGVKIAFNIRNASDFSNSNPMTEAALDLCLNNIMMNLGSSSLPFVPFSDGNFTPTSALFDPEPAGELQVSKQGAFYYIRAAAQQSTDKDLVWRVLINQGVNRDAIDSRTGVVDFYGIRFVDKTEVETRSAFNKSILVHNAGTDESAPTRINDMFVAGGHGVVGYKATDVAHGKANVDVGSIWSDGTDEWVVYFINDVDNILLVRKNVGTTDKWIISTADFGSGTLTHVSGATNTANIVVAVSVQLQHIPIIRDHLAELRIDDVVITVDDDYKGQRVVVSETYALLNVGSQQAALIADVGNASPDYTNETTITEQKRFYYEFEWNEFGAMSIRMAHSVKAPYRRTALVDYWGGLQLQRLSLSGDSTGGMHDKVFNYIPQIAPVSGLDFENIAEVTNNVLDVFPQASDCDDPNDPASHACLIGKNSSDVVQSGHVFGYSRDEGLGVPATRAASTDTIFRLSPAEKNYIYGVDAKSGDASAGDLDTIAAFRAPFLPTDTTLTIPGVIVMMSGRTYCYITAHQNHTNKKVSIPSKYNGWPITVLKAHSNVTVNSEFVSTGEIDIDVINSYGDVVLRLGS